MKTLYDSFRDYVAVKTSDSGSKFWAGEFVPRDAREGITFLSLPPVLHLRLKRYEYDARQNTITVRIAYIFKLLA